LLNRCASAVEFAALDLGDLEAWIRTASRHQLGRQRAEALQAAAPISLDWIASAWRHAWSCGRCWPRSRCSSRQITTADAELEGRVEALAAHLLSVPGVRGLLAATILAELGDVRRFDRLEQVVAFAGLDASVFESGEFHATRQHISKRGSPHLRRALYLAAFNATRADPELAAYFQRKQAGRQTLRVALRGTEPQAVDPGVRRPAR